MRIEQLKYFIETANCQSINKAAKKLYITQPSLSNSLNLLEHEIGFPLFKRSRTGLILTDKGKKIFDDVMIILNLVNSWSDTNYNHANISGDVCLLTVPSICNFLSPHIVSLKEHFPNIDIFLSETSKHLLLPTLYNSPINLAIIPINSDEEQKLITSGLKNKWYFDLLGADDTYVYVGANNSLSDKDVLTVGDLKKVYLASYTAPDETFFLDETLFLNNIIFHFNSLDNILQIVSENKAVAFLPRNLLRNNFFVKKNLILAKPLQDFKLPSFSIFLASPEKHHLSPAEQEIYTYIKQINW